MKITKLSDDERIIDLGHSMIHQSKDGFELERPLMKDELRNLSEIFDKDMDDSDMGYVEWKMKDDYIKITDGSGKEHKIYDPEDPDFARDFARSEIFNETLVGWSGGAPLYHPTITRQQNNNMALGNAGKASLKAFAIVGGLLVLSLGAGYLMSGGGLPGFEKKNTTTTTTTTTTPTTTTTTTLKEYTGPYKEAMKMVKTNMTAAEKLCIMHKDSVAYCLTDLYCEAAKTGKINEYCEVEFPDSCVKSSILCTNPDKLPEVCDEYTGDEKASCYFDGALLAALKHRDEEIGKNICMKFTSTKNLSAEEFKNYCFRRIDAVFNKELERKI